MQRVRNFDMLELAIATDELSFRDFREIVIFGGDPKHRHCFRVSLLQTTGEFHCRSAL